MIGSKRLASYLFIFLLILFLYYLTPSAKAQTCKEAYCKACLGYNEVSQKYEYYKHYCYANPAPICTYQLDPNPYPKFQKYSLPQNTNTGPGWGCSVPTGCNQGFYCPQYGVTPTPGGGGGCDDPKPTGFGSDCPSQFTGDKCTRIPCSYRADCNCMGCCGGGGSTPTPTPQPTPFCRLFCPGQENLRGGMDLYTGGGVNNILFPPTPVLPTQAIGFIDFYGYNKFACSSFDDAKAGPKACPEDEEREDYGQFGGFGFTSHWIYPTPTTNPIRYNMLCGGQAHIYTAVATSGERSGQEKGHGIGPSPTAGPSPTPFLYPPGCNLNGIPTPTIIGGGTKGDQSARDAQQGHGSFIGGNPNSCSCSVTVACQSELQPIIENSCDNNCNFTITPDNPVYNELATFSLTGTPSQISFDDNTDTITNPPASLTHKFLNAGVYRVSLSCGAQTCTKTLNSYCYFIPKLWYKLKDASFSKHTDLVNPLPTTVLPFDNTGDDPGDRVLVTGDSGTVLSETTVNTGSAPTSIRDWKRASYSLVSSASSFPMTGGVFVDYIKSRKQYVTITDTNGNGIIESGELISNKINMITGNFTVDSPSIQSKSPFLLVVIGDVAITGNINPPAKSMAIITTGAIKINSTVTELNGIFIANSVDFASDIIPGNTTANTLKITGNLISLTNTDTNKRKRDDIQKPSLYIIVKPEMYLDLLPMISIRHYEWRE